MRTKGQGCDWHCKSDIVMACGVEHRSEDSNLDVKSRYPYFQGRSGSMTSGIEVEQTVDRAEAGVRRV